MRTTSLLLAAASAALFSLSAASAADLMPLKAAKLVPTFADGGRGFYATIGTEAAVAQSNVNGTNLFVTGLVGGDLKAAGGAVCGGVGFINGNVARWWRVEASACYQNITGGDAAVGGGKSVASRWSATQEVDIGMNVFQSVISAVGNLGVNFPTFEPSLPANVSVLSAPRQYVGAGFRSSGLEGSFGAASGSTWSAAPMIKSGFIWQTVDAGGRPNGGAIDAYAWAAFPMRGITFNNAFAANGTPVTVGAGANLGKQYGVGIRYMFGL